MVQNRYARLAPGLFFAVYLLAFLLIEFAVNDNAALLFGAKSVNGIYSAGLCCTALGYLAFPLLRRLTKGERARLLVLTLICLLLVASVVPLMLAPRPFFLPCAFLSLLCAGYIGGMAHYFLALALQNSRCTGRVVGFAIAGESLLQFFIQSYLETAPLLIASVAVCVAAIFFIVRFPPGDWVLDNPLPYGEGGVPPGRKLAVAGATVCLMSVIVSLDDTIAIFLHAEGSVDLTGVVRLSYAGAVLLFGFVADIKKRAYLPFMAACVLAGSTLMFAFLDSPETYSINAVLLYILSASSVVYLTVAFLDLAPRTAHPELWAGMGRVLRSFSVAATAVPFIRLYDAAGHADDGRGLCGDGGGAGALLCGRAVLPRQGGVRGPRPGRERAGRVRGEIRPHAPRDGRPRRRAVQRQGPQGDRLRPSDIRAHRPALLQLHLREDRHPGPRGTDAALLRLHDKRRLSVRDTNAQSFPLCRAGFIYPGSRPEPCARRGRCSRSPCSGRGCGSC